MIGQRKLGIIRATVELLIAMLLVFLASDELYLYYMGAWRGETKIIEVSEVVLLYACIVLGIGYFIWRVRHIRKRGFSRAEIYPNGDIHECPKEFEDSLYASQGVTYRKSGYSKGNVSAVSDDLV